MLFWCKLILINNSNKEKLFTCFLYKPHTKQRPPLSNLPDQGLAFGTSGLNVKIYFLSGYKTLNKTLNHFFRINKRWPNLVDVCEIGWNDTLQKPEEQTAIEKHRGRYSVVLVELYKMAEIFTRFWYSNQSSTWVINRSQLCKSNEQNLRHDTFAYRRLMNWRDVIHLPILCNQPSGWLLNTLGQFRDFFFRET